MSCTVNVLCYKSKTLSNGEHPLMICVSKNGKRKYQSLGISIHPKFWDFEKNKPKRNCPNKEVIQKLINDKVNELSDKILELKASERDFIYCPKLHTINNKKIPVYFNIQGNP